MINKHYRHYLFALLLLCLCRYAMAVDVAIEITGVDGIDKKMLIDGLSISTYPSDANTNNELIERLAGKGVKEITTALQTFGYYEPLVNYSVRTVDKKLSVNYQVTLGKPVIVQLIDIVITGDGMADTVLLKWKSDFPLKTGERLNQLKYEDAKRELMRILHNRGYFKQQFLQRAINVDTQAKIASIIIRLDTGARHHYGEIQFTQGEDVFDQNYLKNFISFDSGGEFETSDLIESQQHFAMSDEFQSVEVEPLLNKIENEQVPIAIRLNPKKPNKYELGAGYATDTGPRIFASIERRQVTRTGHRAKANIQLSKVKSLINASYRIPLTKPYSDYMMFSGERKSEDTDTVVSQTNTMSLDTTYALANWLRTISFSYLREHYELNNDEVKDSKLLIPGITFEYVHEKPQDKNRFNWQFNVGLKGADTSVVSDTSFAQANMYAWLRFPLTTESRLVNYTKLGYSWTSEFKELPASQRYFTGGDYTIRGYTYNSLGPVDANNVLIGGEELFVTSLEFQHRIGVDLYGNVFYDFGNAFNKNDFVAKSGAGVGVGWGFPFGSLHLYAASALSDEGNPWRLHLTVGAEL